jgi:broad specificity phosphatase PhoE
MKIYILRHEDRVSDCTFYSPLTKKGLDNSEKLIEILNNNNINYIFSSPFRRTLQTIYPYSNYKKYKINIEYGLSEIHHEEIIPKKSVGNLLPEYICQLFNYNPEYITIINSDQINYPESNKDVMIRIKKIIKNIITKYNNTDYNILLVTHQSLCINIIKLIKYFSSIEIDDTFLINYPVGKLSLIFDNNDWKFNLIN